jgi:hypothetical protein
MAVLAGYGTLVCNFDKHIVKKVYSSIGSAPAVETRSRRDFVFKHSRRMDCGIRSHRTAVTVICFGGQFFASDKIWRFWM